LIELLSVKKRTRERRERDERFRTVLLHMESDRSMRRFSHSDRSSFIHLDREEESQVKGEKRRREIEIGQGDKGKH